MAIFINNRALLAEIHSSKSSCCFFTRPEYGAYDAIVGSLEEITPEVVAEALARRRRGLPKAVAGDIIIRVTTDQHLPLEEDDAVRRRGRRSSNRVRVVFPPFEHVRLQDGAWVVVGRSHWRGDLETGRFDAQRGRVTNALALLWQTMAENYGRRGNWRNYSWLDDMRAQAMVQLSQVGLQFDESKSSNPFSFYTTVLSNVFKRAINIEARQASIRDDLIIMGGATPSFKRQIADEIAIRRES